MPTYRLTLEYDGTDFAGWQIQPRVRTAMGVLAGALRAVTGEQPAITAAGRTDSGAHAHGQVAGVTLARNWEAARLRAALDASLPADLSVVGAELAADGFDARHDAVDRTYRYVLITRDGRSPVTRAHAWTVRGPLDIDAMRAASARLIGTHDFAAFGSPPHPAGTTTRTVHDVTILRSVIGGDRAMPGLDTAVITVRANAFLRGMMRSFTGALVKIGEGRAPVEWLARLVDNATARDVSVPVAPAAGLHQWCVSYARSADTIEGVAA